MTKAKLRARWRSLAETAQSSIEDAVRKRRLIDDQLSPFGTTDGLADLRGLPYLERLRVSGCRMKDVDLSFAGLQHAWLEGCEFENVRFDHADLSEISDQGNKFLGCSFKRASFKGAGLGYLGSKYDRCRFVQTDFRRAVFTRAEMDDCLFSQAKLSGADLNASSFVRCQFEGTLQGVWFRGGFPLSSDTEHFGVPRENRMAGVSFERATLRDVVFSDGCDLSSVVMPAEGDYRKISNLSERLEAVAATAEAWSLEERTEAELFVYAYSAVAKNQQWFILNCDDIRENFGGVVLGDKIIAALEA